MSQMDKVDAFLEKVDQVISEVEVDEKGLRRFVRTPQGLRRFGDAIGTPIELNKPGKPDPKKPASPDASSGSAPKLPEHAPLKPKNATPTAMIHKGVALPKTLVDGLKKINHRGTPNGKGTPEDPIDVGTDIDMAVKLLGEGKSIRMKSAEHVGSLIEELAKIGNDAREKGTKAPDYDLCKVSVPGTNLFCIEHKGIPRAQMPQFKGMADEGTLAASKRKDANNADEEVDVEAEFRAALDAMGVKVEPARVLAADLKATQSQLVGVKVAGMAKAMEAGKIPEAPIFVTRDGYIVDGHHRWAAKVAVDSMDGKLGDIEMPVEIIDMEIGEAIDFANMFAKIVGLKSKAGAGVGAKSLGCGCGDPVAKYLDMQTKVLDTLEGKG